MMTDSVNRFLTPFLNISRSWKISHEVDKCLTKLKNISRSWKISHKVEKYLTKLYSMGESSLMRTLLLSTQEPSGSSISRLGLKSVLIDAICNNALLGNDILANSRNLAMHCWELFRSWSSSHYWLGKACRMAGGSSFWSSWSWSTRSPPFLLVFCF